MPDDVLRRLNVSEIERLFVDVDHALKRTRLLGKLPQEVTLANAPQAHHGDNARGLRESSECLQIMLTPDLQNISIIVEEFDSFCNQSC